MASEPPPPPGGRQRRLGSGWIAGRGNSPSQPRPDAPGPITAELGTNGQVTLRWEDRSTNETGFRVEQQILAGPNWQHEGTYTVGPGREQVQVTVVTGTHRFRVMSFNGGGLSSPSGWTAPVVVDNPEEPDPLPAVPTNLHAVDTEMGSVNVHWDDNSANENGFSIQRDPPFPYPGGLRHTGANVQMISDPVGPGTYRYRVRAFNDAGVSEFSEWATVAVADQAPDAPSNLVCGDRGNQSDVLLSWVDNSDNEDAFNIERQTQVGGQWVNTTLRTVSANTTSYVDAAGTGTFRYRVNASNGEGQSSWTPWVTISITDGWTTFTPSSDTRIIYVSSSMGNDSNNGLSEAAPKRTLAAGYALLRNGYPDWLLLRRGDTWVNQSFPMWEKSGRDEDEPMVVGTYGTSPARPLIQTGRSTGLTTAYGPNENYSLHDLAFVGFEMVAHTYDGSTGPVGIYINISTRNLLLEDLKIVGFSTNLILTGPGNSTGVGIHNLRLRRCVIIDAYCNAAHSQGLFGSRLHNALIEENVFDNNGWRQGVAEPTIFNHDIYITNGTTNVVLSRNIISNASSHGLQLRSGGEIRENLFYRNALGLLMGGGDTVDPPPGVTGSIIDNVILEGKDISPTLRRGFGIDLKNIASATVRGNIIADKLTNTGAFAIGSYVSGGPVGVGVNNCTIADNYILNWSGPFQLTNIAAPGTYTGNTFSNNTVVDLRSSNGLVSTPNINSSNVAFANNRFWSSGGTNVFSHGGGNYNLANWRSRTGDVGSTFSQMSVDSQIDLGAYAAHAGLGTTGEDFINACRNRSRFNWNAATDPRAVLTYFRQHLP